MEELLPVENHLHTYQAGEAVFYFRKELNEYNSQNLTMTKCEAILFQETRTAWAVVGWMQSHNEHFIHTSLFVPLIKLADFWGSMKNNNFLSVHCIPTKLGTTMLYS